MAMFKRLTDLDGESIYVNLDLVRMICRLEADDELPSRTRLVFDGHDGDDSYEEVLETPHSIAG